MFKREKGILRKIAEELSYEKRILRLIAYGSRIRGDNMEGSDFDVLIIVDKKDRSIKDKIIDIIYSYELKMDISFSVTIFSIEEWEFNKKMGSPFIKNIEKEGLILYDSRPSRKKGALRISS